MSYIPPSSTFASYISYDFTGRVPRDMSARHAFIQAQAPLTPVTSSTTGDRFITDSTGQIVPVPLFFETNDLLQTTANASNVIQVFGDTSNSAPPFTQRRSGLLTTVDTANRVTIQNQRDITSYVVGDPTIYNTQFATIQQAIDQAVADGVDVSVVPKREAQIIIKPGTYPDNITIPRHGIALIALGSGVSKDVTITGTLTVAPTDSPAKTLILIRGLHFEPSVPPAVVVTTPVAFNPKVLFDDCLVEGQINLNGSLSNVEFSATKCNLENIFLSGVALVTVFLDNTSAQTIYMHSVGNGVTLQNQSQASFTSFDPSGNPPLLASTTTVFAQNSSIAGGINELSGVDHSAQSISLTVKNCNLNLIAYGQFSQLYLINCFTDSPVVLGDAASTNANNIFTAVPQVAAIIQNCIWSSTVGSLTINAKSDGTGFSQTIVLENCSFVDVPGASPNLALVDNSPAAAPGATTTFALQKCSFRTPVLVSGPNAVANFTACVHDVRNTIIDAGGGNFAAIYGGSPIAPTTVTCYNNSFTLRNITGNDFVIYGANNINWTYRTQLPAGFPCNVITNTGATGANLLGGAVAVVDSGYSMV